MAYSRHWAIGFVAVAMLAGCGPGQSEKGSSAGSAGSAGSEGGSAGTGGSAGSSGASGSSGAAGSGQSGDCSAPSCKCDTCWASETCKGTPHDAAVDACINNPEGLEVVKITTDAFEIASGEEVFKCQNFANPFGKDVEIQRTESYMTQGSHHMFAFEAPGAVDSGVESCSGLELERSIHTSQSPYNEFRYPAGVAVNFPASFGVRVNAHYLNTTVDPISARVTTVFYLAKPGTIQHHAAHIFLNNIGIFVEPHSAKTVTKTCTMPKDLQIVAAASHMHQYGKRFVAESGGKMLYETTNWADPPFQLYDPPFALKQGETITFKCEYDNPTESALTFGESAKTNEMCIFSGRYFPSDNGQTVECF
jgi:hypothetical protein